MWAFLQPSYPVFRVLWCISWCGVSSNQGWSDSNQSGTLPLTWIRGRSRSVRIQGVPSCSSSLKMPRTSLSGPKAVRTRTAPATPADRPSTSSRPAGPHGSVGVQEPDAVLAVPDPKEPAFGEPLNRPRTTPGLGLTAALRPAPRSSPASPASRATLPVFPRLRSMPPRSARRWLRSCPHRLLDWPPSGSPL